MTTTSDETSFTNGRRPALRLSCSDQGCSRACHEELLRLGLSPPRWTELGAIGPFGSRRASRSDVGAIGCDGRGKSGTSRHSHGALDRLILPASGAQEHLLTSFPFHADEPASAGRSSANLSATRGATLHESAEPRRFNWKAPHSQPCRHSTIVL